MTQPVTWDNRDGVGLITVENPPVNAISGYRAAIFDLVEGAQQDDSVHALVLICTGRTFIAGADMRELHKAVLQPVLPSVVDAIDESAGPMIAAIHGLGSGLELALACGPDRHAGCKNSGFQR